MDKSGTTDKQAESETGPCVQTATLNLCLHRSVAVSGDSSVVTRWTVDQEVVGSNPTHGGNLISVVRSLSGFTQPIR